MAVQTQIQVRRGTASSWTSTNPTLAAGEIGFESDTGKIKVGTGSATWNSLTYIGAANAIQYVYNASAGQTTFSGADANGATLAYTVGAEQVYVNGVLQVRGTDYTATNGTSVVLTTATIASDIVTVIAYGTFTVADTYTQAQANATFPLNTSAFFAGKNKIINGDFGIWQRGTTTNLSNGVWTYLPDRFQAICNFSAGTATFSQQTFTPGTAPVAGYEGTYFARLVSASTITNAMISQRIENVRTFAGQTVTLSFWIKGSSAITPTIYFTQNFGSGGSAGVDTTTTFTTTTGWTRVTATVTLPSVSGKTIGTGSYLDVVIYHTTASFTLDIWGVQLEAGSVATAFQTATGTIQGELAACQRYYWRVSTTSSDLTARFGPFGAFANGTTAYLNANYPVTMRRTPTAVEFSNLYLYDFNSDITVTNVTLTNNCQSTQTALLTCSVASGGTQYRPVAMTSGNSANGYIGLTAEL